jgi:GAF domain-containing protein/HAMP domain-containing protein
MNNSAVNGAEKSNGRWQSIAVQLPLLVISALVISIVVTGLVGGGFSLSGLSVAIRSNMDTLSLLQARQIEQQFSQHLNTMQGLAVRDSIVSQLIVANRVYAGLDEEALAAHLATRSQTWSEALARDGRESNALVILTARSHSTVRSDLGPEQRSLLLNLGIGSEFIIVDQYGAVMSATRVPDNYLQTDQWWWSELQRQDAPLARGPLPHPDQPNQQIMEFVVPIRNDGGMAIGALYSTYSYGAVQETLGQLLEESGRAILLDGDGRVIYAPPDIAAFHQFEIPLNEAAGNLYRFRGPDNQWYILTALPIVSPINTLNNLNWHVAVLQPQSAFVNPIIGAVLPAFLIASLISLLAVGLLYLFYISPLSTDMRRLQAGAEAVQQGALQTQVAVRRNDELGALGSAFNQMAARLQNQIQKQDQIIAQRTTALQKQARQLETTANVGRAANASLDLATLMRDAVNLIRGGFGYYHVAIFLIDNQNKYAVVHEATGEVGRLLKERPHRLAIGSNSLVGQAAVERQARISNHIQSDPDYRQNPLLPDTRAEAALPLLAQGQLLGILDIQSSDSNAFTEEDRSLLQLMTDQIAAAIYNARLFRESQVRLQETEALFQFTSLLTTTLDAHEIYRRAARALSEQIDAARCRFAYWDANGQTLSSQLEFINHDGPRLIEEFISHESGEIILDQPHLLETMRAAEPLLIRLDDEDAAPAEIRRLEEMKQATVLHLPLLTGNQSIGLVSLYRSPDQAVFSDYEARLAQAMVNQAATALNNALLTSQAQNQVAQMSTLYRISQTLSLAPDLKSVFVSAQQEIMSLTNATGISLLLLNEARSSLRWLYAFEYGQEVETSHLEPIAIERGFTGYVARTEEPLLLKELTPEVRQKYGSRTVEGSASAASYLGLPLQVAKEVIGVLAVENGEETNAFNEQDVQLLTTIAGSVAIAIQNQRLWEQMQTALVMQSEQGLRLQAAAEVAAAASSILSREELMQTAVNLIQERFALYYVGIFLIDASGQNAVLQVGTGEAGRQQLARQYQLPVGGRSLVGSATATGESRIEQNVRDVEDWRPNPFLPDTQSEVALPLHARGQTIGALTVQSAQPNEFTPELVRILQTMSDQLATAIENAQLLAQTERQVRQQKLLNDVSARLHQTANIEEIVRIGLTAISEQLDGTAVQLQLGQTAKIHNGRQSHSSKE